MAPGGGRGGWQSLIRNHSLTTRRKSAEKVSERLLATLFPAAYATSPAAARTGTCSGAGTEAGEVGAAGFRGFREVGCDPRQDKDEDERRYLVRSHRGRPPLRCGVPRHGAARAAHPGQRLRGAPGTIGWRRGRRRKKKNNRKR